MTFDEMLQVGNKLRFDYGGKNINNQTLHIRAIVDGGQVVSRTWSKRKQRWSYQVQSVYNFELAFVDGQLKYLGKSK